MAQFNYHHSSNRLILLVGILLAFTLLMQMMDNSVIAMKIVTDQQEGKHSDYSTKSVRAVMASSSVVVNQTIIAKNSTKPVVIDNTLQYYSLIPILLMGVVGLIVFCVTTISTIIYCWKEFHIKKKEQAGSSNTEEEILDNHHSNFKKLNTKLINENEQENMDESFTRIRRPHRPSITEEI